MTVRVAGGVDEGEVFCFCKPCGVLERRDGLVEVEEGGMEEGRIKFRECAVRTIPFCFCDEDGSCGEVVKAVGMIEVEVGKDDSGDVFSRETDGSQLVVDLIFAGDSESELRPVEPGGKDAGWFEIIGAGDVGAFAGVYEEVAFGMLNYEGPDREPRCKAAVEDKGGDGEEVRMAGFAKAGFHGDGAGRKEVEADGMA